MAPIALSSTTTESPSTATLKLNLRSAQEPTAETTTPVDPGLNRLSGPLPYTGSLDSYPHFEVTPSIGREFGKELQLTDLLAAENSDELIRDLAVLSEFSPWLRCRCEGLIRTLHGVGVMAGKGLRSGEPGKRGINS